MVAYCENEQLRVHLRARTSRPFKSKVDLEVIRAVKRVNEIAQGYEVHPTQVG
jgi:hypothetical protein